MTHQITGFFFFTQAKTQKKYVIYSTMYKQGRFASMHECSGLSDEQARGKFILEHSKEVDRLLMEKKRNDNKQKIIV